MAFFEWKPEYSVGIASIDGQHKKLIGMLNRLFEAMSTGTGDKVLGDILKELVQYVATHFKMEEDLMKAHAYPEYEEHKKKHDAMTIKVVELRRTFQAGTAKLTIPVSNFLKDWLQKHILETDQRYSSFLLSKGVK